MAADISRSLRHNLESLFLGRDNGSDPQLFVGDTTSAATVDGVYSRSVSVSVPSITDPDSASVDVDVSAFAISVAVGDQVLVTPSAALPTNALLSGAYVVSTDTVRVVYTSVGGNVTGSAVNHKITVIKVTNGT